MEIYNKERTIEKKQTEDVVIIKRGEKMTMCSDFQSSYDKTYINNPNNNIRKDVNYGN